MYPLIKKMLINVHRIKSQAKSKMLVLSNRKHVSKKC